MVKDIIIVGPGGHGQVVTDVIRLTAQYRIRGYIDTINPERSGEAYQGSTVLGGEEVLPRLRKDGVNYAHVAIGDNVARARLGGLLSQLGFVLDPLIHPSAIIGTAVSIGEGTVAFAGVIVNAATRIGSHVILNTRATIEHDCVIGDAVHVGPGVTIGGGVTVGDGCLIGVGASIKPGVKIGRNAVVGVGAAVVADVPDGATVVGVPASVMK